MEGRSPRSPVLIIGMHRSGTSVLARMLEQLGLFLGWRKQGDHEALFFLRLNNWLFEQCGGRWDHPEPVRELIKNAEARELVLDYLQLTLRSPRAVSFLGPRHLLQRTPYLLRIPWGWKDPRTSFTLPIWLELFPEARVIHVRRHGVDVAASLRARHRRILSAWRERYQKLKPMYLFRFKKSGFSTSLRCASIDDCFALWESYLQEASQQTQRLAERGTEVRYEDMLDDPVEVLSRLSTFCGISDARERISTLAESVRPNRAFAYRQSTELRAFATANSERLRVFGY